MTDRTTEYSVSIVVWGFDCGAEMITNTLKTSPSETWSIGSPVLPGATKLHKENGWKLKAIYTRPPENLGEAMRPLIGAFREASARLDDLPRPHARVIQCSVYSYDRSAVLHIANDVLAWVAEVGAELDIDYYELPPE